MEERIVMPNGWIIERIYQSSYGNGKNDYFVSHPLKDFQGRVFMNKTLNEVKKLINPRT